MTDITADGLPLFMQCNGSTLIEAREINVPVDTTVRDEGTAAHYVAVRLFNGERSETLINTLAPNNVVITSTMIDDVRTYLSTLDCGAMEVETSWCLNTTDGQLHSVNGRCDHFIFRQELSTLTVDDLKYGYTIVEPYENWSLIAHAVGLCSRLQIAPARIVLRIYQPRAWHVDGPLREWSISYEELMRYAQRIVDQFNNTPVLTTGPACLKCRKNTNCTAARQNSRMLADFAAEPYDANLPDDVIGFELDVIQNAIERLTARQDQLSDLAKTRIRNGGVIENYQTVNSTGNRAWLKTVDLASMERLLNIDLHDKPKPVTPAEAVRRGVSKIVVDGISHKPDIGLKLVRLTPEQYLKQVNKKAQNVC